LSRERRRWTQSRRRQLGARLTDFEQRSAEAEARCLTKCPITGLFGLAIEGANGLAYIDEALGMSMALAVPKLLAALP
jgi:hypothetical protein